MQIALLGHHILVIPGMLHLSYFPPSQQVFVKLETTL